MSEQTQGGFDSMPLGPATLATLREIGYLTPSPIQRELIPEAFTNRDIIGQAKTGTGKTASFMIPILERINNEQREPQALILGPTRELICQVRDESTKLRGDREVKIAAVYGGQPLGQQIRQLDSGAQVVVGTPGRVLDLMRRGCLNIGGINTLVLDEADRMLDIGFRPDIERILRKTPTDRQTLLLSATMPDAVLKLTTRYMKEPLRINLSSDEVAVDTIKQRYFTVDEDRKLALLLHLLVREKPRQCIIFCQMKTGVRKLAHELGKRIRGVTGMRGDLPQGLRDRVMRDFRSGKIRILVATDVVGRGIDIDDISHVINYDVPEDPEWYVHRIGRTGRMGKDGLAFTFVTPEQGGELTTIEALLNQQIESDSIDGFSAVDPAPSSGRRFSSKPRTLVRTGR